MNFWTLSSNLRSAAHGLQLLREVWALKLLWHIFMRMPSFTCFFLPWKNKITELSTHIFPNAKTVWEQNFCMNSTLRIARRSHLVTYQKFRNCWFYEVRSIILKFFNESFLTSSILIESPWGKTILERWSNAIPKGELKVFTLQGIL